MATGDTSSLPKHWPEHVLDAVVQATSLANTALIQARGWAADSCNARLRLRAKNDQLESEVALLRRELALLRARLERVPAKNRPHYLPTERLAILELKAARCWNAAQVARRFLLSAATIADWLLRLNRDGQEGFLETPQPVNRFPNLVAHVVQSLRAQLPTMGKLRIAQMLAHAGLHLSVATVARMAARQPLPCPPAPKPTSKISKPTSSRTVTAKSPNHVWNVDFTAMPTALGFWVPWLPFALPQAWPFGWYVGLVVDHFSRKILGFQVFRQHPSADRLCAMLDRCVLRVGATPKYIVSDQGVQFGEDYRAWCSANGVNPRFGAVGRHGSIAITERCIRSLKSEALRRTLVPLCLSTMMTELEYYVVWFNEHRPHQGLHGRTPSEVFDGLAPARDGPRFETRARFPLRGALARGTPRKLAARRGVKLRLVVDNVEGRQHLPIVALRRAA